MAVGLRPFVEYILSGGRKYLTFSAQIKHALNVNIEKKLLFKGHATLFGRDITIASLNGT